MRPIVCLVLALGMSADTIHYVEATGQSLSVGVNGSPALSTTQPYSNLMLSGTSLVPLTEVSGNIETIGSAMANTLTLLSPSGWVSLVHHNGVSGTAYSGLNRVPSSPGSPITGTVPYQNYITALTNAKAAADAAGRTIVVSAVDVIHGETDFQPGVTPAATYKGYLVQWLADYDYDAKRITGQSSSVKLFTDQMAQWNGMGFNTPTTSAFPEGASGVPIGQWQAAMDYSDTISLVCPKYFFAYSDNLHLTNVGYRLLGQYHGKAMKKVLIDGQKWIPLMPRAASISGATITVQFWVPSGSLTWDTTALTDRTVSATGGYSIFKGFEFKQTGGNAATVVIADATITASDTVQITLSGTPTGTNQRIRYAFTGAQSVHPDAATAAHGNLRDTDSTVGSAGSVLPNWAVTFDAAMGFAWSPNTATAPTPIKRNQAAL